MQAVSFVAPDSLGLTQPSRRRVLVASNDLQIAAVLDPMLTLWGYAPQLATDGLEALRILTSDETLEIALLDSTLPQIGGIELAAEARIRAPKHTVWTMLLCSEVNIETISGATDAGIDDLLLKPVQPADLRIRLGVAERVQVLKTQLEAQQHAVRFHATHDPLTGMWNRDSLLRLLFSETDRVQRLKTPLSLMLLDIDQFGRVNQNHGYEAGDKILQELANRFRRYLRSYDLIGRCGEDEFLIALPGCTPEEALMLAARLKKNILHRPFPVGREQLSITASIGIADSKGRSPLVVLREAEQALAQAKLAGRNCERQYVRSEVQAIAAKKQALNFLQLETTVKQ
jgi:two-component system, cell cycle response regulator